MTDYSDPASRRRFLKLVGGSVVFVPLAGLSGCGGGDDSSGSADTGSKPAAGSGQSGGSAADTSPGSAPSGASGTMADSAGDGPPRLSLDDPQAKALGYVHDAANVDQSKYARHQPGQACSNCALFQGMGDQEWARCSIFPGKLVNSAGWCSAYAPKG